METINNAAKIAANVVWGQSNPETKKADEPISGVQGDTSKGEPFDAGNRDEMAGTTTSSTGTTGTTAPGATGTTTGVTSGTTGLTGATDSTSATGATGTTGTTGNTGTTGVPDTTSTTGTTGTTGLTGASDTTGTTGHTGPTTEHPSSTTKHDASLEQADAGHKQESSNLDSKTAEARKNVDNSDGVDTSENPAKVEGPGPRTVAEVAKEHGGDAGATGGATTSSSSAGGQAGGKAREEDIDPNDPAAPSSGEGTGEKYVKSSGLAADGGDFDATKPGAGKEADRLLEEKGVHNPATEGKSTGLTETTTSTSTSDTATKEKKSLKEKIKEKLHRN